MPFIAKKDSPEFSLHGAIFRGLAAPSRGARETAAWRFTLEPNAPGLTHHLTREEIIMPLAGRATAMLDGKTHELVPGSALVVPPHVDFSLANASAEPFEAIAIIPVGGQAVIGAEPPFTPPWAA
jgi:quercetin dioxygenase-like cupin family protein